MNQSPSRAARRLLVLGLDGATMDLLRPWVEQGRLPNLSSLMSEGTAVPLRSTIPPITPPAWTSLFTGRNPGKHRVFDFAEPAPDSYSLQYLNGGQVQGPTLWGLLGRAGRRVTVVNVPMTYPPRPVEGCLISGLDAPDESCTFTYPRQLYGELCRDLGGYRIDIRHLGNMHDDRRRDETLQAFIELERARGEATLYLMKRHPADFTFVVFNATDQVQHHFWHYMDPDHPRHDPERAGRYGDAILRVYEEVDRQVGRLLEEAGPETAVAVVSDHGFGPTGDRVFHINQYLAERGFLSFRAEAGATALSRAAHGVDSLLRRTLSSRTKASLARLFPKLRSGLETMATSPVDWSRTRAFVQEAYLSSPNIWINREDRFSQGTVAPADYYKVVEEVRQALLEVRDPDTGSPLLDRVYLRDEVFRGPHLHHAPDLILPWWEEGAFQARASGRNGVGTAPAVHKDTGPLRGGLEFVAEHRMHGVLIAARGPFRAGASLEAGIMDIAPTLLHLMGVPVPRDMDGRVLLEAFEEGWLCDNPVRYADGEDGEEDSMEAYSEEEERKIRERLQGIGYL